MAKNNFFLCVKKAEFYKLKDIRKYFKILKNYDVKTSELFQLFNVISP